jgi:hypothetical protein
MLAKHGSTWITGPSYDHRAWSSAFGVRINGKQLVQQEPLVRATVPFLACRGNKSNTVSFGVTRTRATAALAQAWAGQFFDTIEAQEDLLLYCGFASDSVTLQLDDAIMESCDLVGFNGCTVSLQFSFIGLRLWVPDPPPALNFVDPVYIYITPGDNMESAAIITRFDITDLTGGATGCLDAIPTANGARVAGKSCVLLNGGDKAGHWALFISDDPEDGINVVWPDDRSVSNPVVWMKQP